MTVPGPPQRQGSQRKRQLSVRQNLQLCKAHRPRLALCLQMQLQLRLQIQQRMQLPIKLLLLPLHQQFKGAFLR